MTFRRWRAVALGPFALRYDATLLHVTIKYVIALTLQTPVNFLCMTAFLALGAVGGITC
jgi:hypothetical protein